MLKAARPTLRKVTIAEARHGTFATFAADECIGEAIRRYGEWAQGEIELLSPYIRPDGVVIDVGANIGTHSIAWGRKIGPPGFVVALEANPETFALLSYNVVANDLLESVRPINAVVGETPGAAIHAHTILAGEGNYGSQVFTPEAQRQQNLSTAELIVTIPAITLDSLGLKRCDVMKIDVETMEGAVVRGSLATIGRCRPVVYFEQIPGREETSLEIIFDALKPLGYRLFWHVSDPFNPRNLKGDPHNIFGGATELCVLCLPSPLESSLREIRSKTDRFSD